MKLDEIRALAAQQAAADLESGERALAAGGARSPLPGDLFVLPSTADFAVEWLVLELSAEGGNAWVIPADLNPALGTDDWAVDPTAGSGDLSLRCGLGARVSAEGLQPELRSGSLDKRDLDSARRIFAEAQRHGAPGPRQDSTASASRSAPPEADLESWYAQVLHPARAALLAAESWAAQSTAGQARASQPGSDLSPAAFATAPPPWRRAVPWAMAASALLGLGLSWATATERQEQIVELRASAATTASSHAAQVESLEGRLAAEAQNAARTIGELQERLAAQDSELVADGSPSHSPAATAPAQAVLNPRLEWFQPQGEETRGEPPTVELAAADTEVYFVLETWSPERFEELRVELLSHGDGAVIWASDELRLQGSSEVIFGLPAELLAGEQLRFRLYGLRDGVDPQLLEDYPFRLRR